VSKYTVVISTEVVVTAKHPMIAVNTAWNDFCDKLNESLITNSGYRFNIQTKEE